MAEGIAWAEQPAHAAGGRHRDWQPAHILLAAGGIPTVTDFGLATIGSGNPGGQSEPGRLAGSGRSMAPATLLRGRGARGPGMDIYGLGCLLYEMLTGRPARPAVTVAEALQMARKTVALLPLGGERASAAGL